MSLRGTDDGKRSVSRRSGVGVLEERDRRRRTINREKTSMSESSLTPDADNLEASRRFNLFPSTPDPASG